MDSITISSLFYAMLMVFQLLPVQGYQSCWSWVDSHMQFSLRCPTGNYYVVVSDVQLVQSEWANNARSLHGCPQSYTELQQQQCEQEKRTILDHVRQNCNLLPSCAVSAYQHHQLTTRCDGMADYTVVNYNCFQRAGETGKIIPQIAVPNPLPPKVKGNEVNIVSSDYPHMWVNLNSTISCTLTIPADTDAKIDVVEATCEDTNSVSFVCPYLIQIGGYNGARWEARRGHEEQLRGQKGRILHYWPLSKLYRSINLSIMKDLTLTQPIQIVKARFWLIFKALRGDVEVEVSCGSKPEYHALTERPVATTKAAPSDENWGSTHTLLWIIVGACIGVGLIIALIAVLIYFCCKRKKDKEEQNMVFASTSYADPMTIHSLNPPGYTPLSAQNMLRKNSNNLHYHSTSLYKRSNSETEKPIALPPKSMKKYYNTAPRGSLQYCNIPFEKHTAKSLFDAMYDNDYPADEQVPVYDRVRTDAPVYQVPVSMGYTDVDSGVDVETSGYRGNSSPETKPEEPQYSTFSLQRKKSQSSS